ncbi:calcitonin gene-related peptide type 1 receptor-like [Oppia nitens]|uniref:calcitonin gene-related peptide type 1 receptor-like n=1 Tax=Oppia nitens TaxID=1686743 RepID=UPI0023DA3F3E|nr:calcitonin gene-related peptide type 1 receptor-like [Oppia nitens]
MGHDVNRFRNNLNAYPSQYFRASFNCTQTAHLTPKGWHQSDSYCTTTFDGIGCWTASLGNTTVVIPCPEFIDGFNSSNTAIRNCLVNGSWALTKHGVDQGDYFNCHNDPHFQLKKLEDQQLHELWEEMEKLDPLPYSNIHTAHAFEDCIDTVLVGPKTQNKELLYCPRTFDGWGCFNDTLAGQVAYISCPDFITGFVSTRKARKECQTTGEWYRHFKTNKTWSNYTDCVDWDDLQFRQSVNNIYITGYSISLVALLISLAIFFSFKSLSTQTRIRIHKNFFLSFIINNLMWIVWYLSIVSEPNVLNENPIWCQVIHVAVHYFMVCNYFWMFCEGLYLHTLLVIAFVSENKILKWFYLLGWGIPIPMILIYALLRSNSHDPKDTHLCWIEEGTFNLLITGPVCMSLLLNLFFLINIVRVLVTKLRAVNTSDTHQTRKAVRATLILIPLLGLQFMLTPFRPETRTTAEKIYEIVSAIVTSLQGLCVALLFCFFNGEVLQNLKKKWNQTLLNHGLSSDTRLSYAATTVSTLAYETQDIPLKFVHRSDEMDASIKEKQLMLREI